MTNITPSQMRTLATGECVGPCLQIVFLTVSVLFFPPNVLRILCILRKIWRKEPPFTHECLLRVKGLCHL